MIAAMPTESGRSFDDAVARLKTGDQHAARQVFEHYVQRLVALAGTCLGGKSRRKVDPEDVVRSVFNSFIHRQRDDHNALTRWDGLWGPLATITIGGPRNRRSGSFVGAAKQETKPAAKPRSPTPFESEDQTILNAVNIFIGPLAGNLPFFCWAAIQVPCAVSDPPPGAVPRLPKVSCKTDKEFWPQTAPVRIYWCQTNSCLDRRNKVARIATADMCGACGRYLTQGP
jgi:hypothetical protein